LPAPVSFFEKRKTPVLALKFEQDQTIAQLFPNGLAELPNATDGGEREI
jgi:hypothetical protein